MRHVESWLAAGMAIMCVITIGLVLYVNNLTDQRDEFRDAIPALLAIIDAQNRTIEERGGTPITLPSTTTTAPRVTQPPPTATTTTSTTTSTSTTTMPCQVVAAGRCIF